MKSNEIRIGNWVYNPIQKIPLRVDFNVLNLIRLDDKFDRVDKFQPIPLTEEILLKCGFEEKMKWTFSINIKNRFDLVYYLGEKGWSLGFYDSSDFRNLKHLHQLQNLYFALTNEELIIEL